MAHFVKGSLITPFPMANSKSVTLHILWKAISSYLFPSTTGCEIFCILWKAVSSHLFLWQTACEWHFVKGSLISSFPMTISMWVTLHSLWMAVSSHLFLHMTNSKWVTLHTLWKVVSSHLFLQPTACEWYCTPCERQSHHIWFLWPSGCKWHCTLYERQSHYTLPRLNFSPCLEKIKCTLQSRYFYLFAG